MLGGRGVGGGGGECVFGGGDGGMKMFEGENGNKIWCEMVGKGLILKLDA